MPSDDPLYIFTTKTPRTHLTLWHKRLGHLSFDILRKYFCCLEIPFIDNVKTKFFCNTCQLTKVTKTYNCTPQSRLTIKYTKIDTNLVGSIILHGFQREKYFFTFIDGAIFKTEIFISHKKKVVYIFKSILYLSADFFS